MTNAYIKGDVFLFNNVIVTDRPVLLDPVFYFDDMIIITGKEKSNFNYNKLIDIFSI